MTNADNHTDAFEIRAKELLALAYKICEEKASKSSIAPPPPLETLCSAATTLQEAIKTFESAVRAVLSINTAQPAERRAF